MEDVAGHLDVVPGDAQGPDHSIMGVPFAGQLRDVVHVQVLIRNIFAIVELKSVLLMTRKPLLVQ